jgi:hypothetical protein
LCATFSGQVRTVLVGVVREAGVVDGVPMVFGAGWVVDADRVEPPWCVWCGRHRRATENLCARCLPYGPTIFALMADA